MNIFNQNNATEYAAKFNNVGINAIRLTMITLLTWIGLMKFTAYEAGAIEGLVASSPLVSWLYSIFSVQMTSNIIGSIEIATAVALLIGFKNHTIGLLGAAAATFTFLLTASFLLSAPVWEASLGGFPALSVVPGQFLLKDIVLLGAALALIGDSFKGIASNNS
ncbi:MAG: DUF417 family protein [Emcibacteraceae bacterium]|nr:DUF417 family protein [Emcibacteraceae bacterium]